ncbi:MAG: hypothetical protein F9K19_24925 [Rhizobiaceae bacterium]|nr:MAG: hypothetical protein F9K19_24925 [Rhizobiaceae bacterium]
MPAGILSPFARGEERLPRRRRSSGNVRNWRNGRRRRPSPRQRGEGPGRGMRGRASSRGRRPPS